MGGGTPSCSTIPTSGLVSSGVGVSFGWNFPSGFGVVSSQVGGNSMSKPFKFPWVSTHLSGGTPLEGNFSNWGSFPFINTSGSGGFFPGLDFGNVFPRGPTSITGGNPFKSMSIPRRTHAPRSVTIPGGTHSLGTPQQPSGSTTIKGL
jgi:hypothetical protein